VRVTDSLLEEAQRRQADRRAAWELEKRRRRETRGAVYVPPPTREELRAIAARTKADAKDDVVPPLPDLTPPDASGEASSDPF
jgi:hypothetical protein